jgi:hypothetical protein
MMLESVVKKVRGQGAPEDRSNGPELDHRYRSAALVRLTTVASNEDVGVLVPF